MSNEERKRSIYQSRAAKTYDDDQSQAEGSDGEEVLGDVPSYVNT